MCVQMVVTVPPKR